MSCHPDVLEFSNTWYVFYLLHILEDSESIVAGMCFLVMFQKTVNTLVRVSSS